MPAVTAPESADRAGRIPLRIAFAVWTVPALLSTLETVMFSSMAHRPMPVWKAFVGEAPQWYGWALLTPIVVELGRRVPLVRPIRWRNAALHLLTILVAMAFVSLADAAVNAWIRPSPVGLLSSARSWFLSGLPAAVVAYLAILGVSYALRSTARLRQREREAAELETRLRDAQLAALRMQLQPHFLFNSLNAVMALVRDQETAQAIRALSLLADVLRAAVSAGDQHETTFGQELDFVRRYLEIERVRFGDRLRVEIDVPYELLDAKVPTFILQPFVENSLKHGMLRGREGNTITIGARAADATLTLTVRDDGRGLGANAAASTGIGIANARARLERMYGGASRLTVASVRDGNGVVVEIVLPRRQSSVGVPAPSVTREAVLA